MEFKGIFMDIHYNHIYILPYTYGSISHGSYNQYREGSGTSVFAALKTLDAFLGKAEVEAATSSSNNLIPSKEAPLASSPEVQG